MIPWLRILLISFNLSLTKLLSIIGLFFLNFFISLHSHWIRQASFSSFSFLVRFFIRRVTFTATLISIYQIIVGNVFRVTKLEGSLWSVLLAMLTKQHLLCKVTFPLLFIVCNLQFGQALCLLNSFSILISWQLLRLMILFKYTFVLAINLLYFMLALMHTWHTKCMNALKIGIDVFYRLLWFPGDHWKATAWCCT